MDTGDSQPMWMVTAADPRFQADTESCRAQPPYQEWHPLLPCPPAWPVGGATPAAAASTTNWAVQVAPADVSMLEAGSPLGAAGQASEASLPGFQAAPRTMAASSGLAAQLPGSISSHVLTQLSLLLLRGHWPHVPLGGEDPPIFSIFPQTPLQMRLCSGVKAPAQGSGTQGVRPCRICHKDGRPPDARNLPGAAPGCPTVWLLV